MKRTRVVSLLACACLGAGLPGRAQTGSASVAVGDLVTRALTTNQNYLAARQQVEQARGLLRQAGVRLVATVEASGTTGRPLGTQGEEEYAVGYFYPLETGGKRTRRQRVAELGLALAEADLAERARQLGFEVQARYIDALAYQRKQEALERLLVANRETFRLTEARVREGDAAPLERDLLATDLGRVEAQRASLLGQAEAALLDLRRLVGLASTETLPLSDARGGPAQPPFEIAPLQQRAVQQRPDLRVVRLLADQGTADVALAEAEARPNVTLSARYARRYAQFDDQLGLTSSGARVPLRDRDDVVTFGVSVPLTRRSRNLGTIEAATAQATGARLRREYLERTIPLEIEAAYRRYTAAQRALTLFEQGVVTQSQRNLAVVREAYQLGQLRALDVLNEQRRVTDTELSYIDAQAELARARADLERAVGGSL